MCKVDHFWFHLRVDLSKSGFDLVACSKYTLKKIVNVEENHDVIKGDRYLIELVSI